MYLAHSHQEISHVQFPHVHEIDVTDIPMNPQESLMDRGKLYLETPFTEKK